MKTRNDETELLIKILLENDFIISEEGYPCSENAEELKKKYKRTGNGFFVKNPEQLALNILKQKERDKKLNDLGIKK